MKNAIILHGMPSKEEYYNINSPSQSNKHWFPWIQKQLILKDILAQTPELPLPFEPVYQDWCDVLKQFSINEETILIGHSCGAGFLLRWLSENNIKVDKIVLVAPWIDPDKTLNTDMFNFKIDLNLTNKANKMAVIYSNNDSKDILDSVEIIRNDVKGIELIELPNKGHFTYNDMKTDQFPELLDFLLN